MLLVYSLLFNISQLHKINKLKRYNLGGEKNIGLLNSSTYSCRHEYSSKLCSVSYERAISKFDLSTASLFLITKTVQND